MQLHCCWCGFAVGCWPQVRAQQSRREAKWLLACVCPCVWMCLGRSRQRWPASGRHCWPHTRSGCAHYTSLGAGVLSAPFSTPCSMSRDHKPATRASPPACCSCRQQRPVPTRLARFPCRRLRLLRWLRPHGVRGAQRRHHRRHAVRHPVGPGGHQPVGCRLDVQQGPRPCHAAGVHGERRGLWSGRRGCSHPAPTTTPTLKLHCGTPGLPRPPGPPATLPSLSEPANHDCIAEASRGLRPPRCAPPPPVSPCRQKCSACRRTLPRPTTRPRPTSRTWPTPATPSATPTWPCGCLRRRLCCSPPRALPTSSGSRSAPTLSPTSTVRAAPPHCSGCCGVHVADLPRPLACVPSHFPPSLVCRLNPGCRTRNPMAPVRPTRGPSARTPATGCERAVLCVPLGYMTIALPGNTPPPHTHTAPSRRRVP
jgi:hypothetical protein